MFDKHVIAIPSLGSNDLGITDAAIPPQPHDAGPDAGAAGIAYVSF